MVDRSEEKKERDVGRRNRKKNQKQETIVE